MTLPLEAQSLTQRGSVRAGFDILGTRVHSLTMSTATHEVGKWIDADSRAFIVFCTASTVVLAKEDPELRSALEDADLVTPDGMPLVWLGRRDSTAPVERVYGPDFLVALIEERPNLRHFFYGGSEGAADEMAERLRSRFPTLDVAGTLCPPHFERGEMRTGDVAIINAARPDVVWVGLGHPKQEIFMHRHRGLLEAPLLAGVGAAFDFLSARKKEAPQWMKRSGLQWLHRLAQDPRRLWKRYLIGNARFVYLVARERIASRKASR